MQPDLRWIRLEDSGLSQTNAHRSRASRAGFMMRWTILKRNFLKLRQASNQPALMRRLYSDAFSGMRFPAVTFAKSNCSRRFAELPEAMNQTLMSWSEC